MLIPYVELFLHVPIGELDGTISSKGAAWCDICNLHCYVLVAICIGLVVVASR